MMNKNQITKPEHIPMCEVVPVTQYLADINRAERLRESKFPAGTRHAYRVFG